MSDTRQPEERQRGIHARVWAIAAPVMLSNLSVPLLGAVDTAVVGHLPDPAYIGGVAVGAIIFSFLYWGFSFLRMGTSGFTAQAYGSGDRDELRAVLARALLLALAIGLLLIVLQLPISWISFHLFEASSEVETQATLYFDIRIWSAPASLANYVMIGWFLGTGRARTMLLLEVTLNGINIVLDLVFVLGFGWGVEGVALASLLAEVTAVSLGLVIIARILKRDGGAFRLARIRDPARLIALFRVNRDILIRTLCLLFAFGYFTAQGAKMSDAVLAANAILLQFFTFMAHGIDGLADATQVLAGNAKGARHRGQFRAAIRAAALWAAGVAIVIALVFWLAGPTLIALFTNMTEVRQIAETYLPWMAVAPLLSVWCFLLDGIFIGTTRTDAMRNAMVASLLLYLAACWVLIPWLGNHGLWLAMMIFMVARALSLAVYLPALDRSIEAAPG
ncbi:MAG: MATE family efflux transporter [Pseudomonadota bacterium]